MTGKTRITWQTVQDEVSRRIKARIWQPGDLIPTEAELAAEFDCARVTVNRALRELAETGVLDRRRKAGTRVAEHPTRRAVFDIPILRQEITATGARYGYALVRAAVADPPVPVRAAMRLGADARALTVQALHLADDRPFVFEDRWINLGAVPAAQTVDFTSISANEWLVRNAVFSRGEVVFSATVADARLAELLGAAPGDALFCVDRRTWDDAAGADAQREAAQVITQAQLTYGPGYRLRTEL